MKRDHRTMRLFVDCALLVAIVMALGLFFLFVGGARGAPLPPHQGHSILPVSAAEAKREKAMHKDWQEQRTANPVSRDRAQLRLVLKRWPNG